MRSVREERKRHLQAELARIEDELRDLRNDDDQEDTIGDVKADLDGAHKPPERPLRLDEYKRYGRQMVLDDWGLEGQVALKKASVLVIGVGGLGCPALQLLAAAGVGRLGLVDHDLVDLSNLQRQILHTEHRLGWTKVASALSALRQLNTVVELCGFTQAIDRDNAPALIGPYDIVLDCTDNPQSRYVINDTCVALGKPLVSGAALRHEGQLVVYNYPIGKGPCYRCLFPLPPSDVQTCQDAGVWAGTTAMVGTCQAIEAIKLLLRKYKEDDYQPTMTLFNVMEVPCSRTVRLRPKKASCNCAKPDSLLTSFDEAISSCARVAVDPRDRMTVREFAHQMKSRDTFSSVLDIRPETEYGIVHLPGSQNIPLDRLAKASSSIPASIEFVICRRGNDSSHAVEILRRDKGLQNVRDIIGGLEAWSRDVDPDFPVY